MSTVSHSITSVLALMSGGMDIVPVSSFILTTGNECAIIPIVLSPVALLNELELRLRKSDGNYRWFLVRYNPVREDKGQIRRWYVACTDIEI
jgi:PAS domain-containing protein